jgi:hypothetical protein
MVSTCCVLRVFDLNGKNWGFRVRIYKKKKLFKKNID